MKIKTSELAGPALRWAVAKTEGLWTSVWSDGRIEVYHPNIEWYRYEPDTDWSQGGPIIVRENISFSDQHNCRGMERWVASLYLPDDNGLIVKWGATHLIAAMRCFVASRLGNEVDVPDELV